jgi:hypothetical protein
MTPPLTLHERHARYADTSLHDEAASIEIDLVVWHEHGPLFFLFLRITAPDIIPSTCHRRDQK